MNQQLLVGSGTLIVFFGGLLAGMGIGNSSKKGYVKLLVGLILTFCGSGIIATMYLAKGAH